MKLNSIVKIVLAGSALSLLASCHNKEQVFPDYDGGITAYFAYQYPVRTIVLGESETFDTTSDNEGKFIIYGTMGGAYEGKDIVIDIEVDETLTENMYFDSGCTNPVKPLPSTHYLPFGTQLKYGGSHMGGVEVQLTEEFFADPDAIKTTYVVPVKMTNIVKGADKILAGTPYIEIEGEPVLRTDPSLWKVQPKDYTLYGVKFINPWDGSWLRRGVDQITGQGAGENVRHAQYVENDEVVFLSTESLDAVTFPVSTKVTNVTTIKDVIVKESGYALHITQDVAQDADWKAQTWYNLTEPILAGETYTLTCMAKATSAYSAQFIFQHDYSEQQFNGYMLNCTDQWEEKTITLTPDLDVYNKLTLCFGNFAGTIVIDNISLTKAGSDVNLIANGDFETGEATGWSSSWGVDPPYHSIGVGFESITEEVKEVTEVVEKTCDVKLTFDESGNCTVSSATEGVTATGEGKFVKDGEKLAWGNKDRDGIYLQYEVNFGEKVYAIKDTLVSRSREVKLETFSPTYKK